MQIGDYVRAKEKALRERGIFIKGDPGRGTIVSIKGEIAYVEWERPSYPWGPNSINMDWIEVEYEKPDPLGR